MYIVTDLKMELMRVFQQNAKLIEIILYKLQKPTGAPQGKEQAENHIRYS